MSSQTSSNADVRLPTRDELSRSKGQERELFNSIRSWWKSVYLNHAELASTAAKLDIDHRRSLFDFLANLHASKRLFKSQAKEVLTSLQGVEAWIGGLSSEEVADHVRLATQNPEVVVQSLGLPPLPPPVSSLGQPPLPPPDSKPPTAESLWMAPPHDPSASVPTPRDGHLQVDSQTEAHDAPKQGLMAKFPPPEAFVVGSKYDEGDTIKELRKWVRGLAVWDLAEAAELLGETERRNVFSFLVRMADRKLYRSISRELIRMLLAVPEWIDGDVLDENAISKVLDNSSERPEPATKPQQTTPPPLEKPSRDSPPLDKRSHAPVRPTDAIKPAKTVPEIPVGILLTPPAALRALLASAIHRRSLGISDGSELVKLYTKSGLGGECGVKLNVVGSAKTADLSHLIAICTQRVNDVYTDFLQQSKGSHLVHFGHAGINLQRKKTVAMPQEVRTSVEKKISTSSRLTNVEKSYVLKAPHEMSVRYIIAYMISRARAGNRKAVWIPVAMTTGSAGHANAIVVQFGSPGQEGKILVYDPNYAKNESHYVHAVKAVTDALPEIRRLLKNVDVKLPPNASLFGHGLQTLLGTVTQKTGIRKIWTQYQGYPICGAIVHLLASLWLETMPVAPARTSYDVELVEAELANFVQESPEGKTLVQRHIAALLSEMSSKLGGGKDSFAYVVKHKLEKDKKEWTTDFAGTSGQLVVNTPNFSGVEFKW